MKILVTGTTGFIGKNLITRLIDDKHNISTIIRSSTNTTDIDSLNIQYYTFDNDIEKLIKFMNKENFDGVIHLASLFIKQHESGQVEELIKSNVLFSTLLLEASVKSNVKWFINIGTFWQHYKNKDYSPVNLYASTKQAFEDIAKYYIETSNINFVTIKLSDTFGGGDTRPKILSIWDKISKNRDVMEMSGGKQIIDINYIDNITDGISHLVKLLTKDSKNNLKGSVFAIKAKERMSLKKLAGLFEKTTGRKLNILWGKKDYMPREVMIPWTKGKNIPGWKPKISIKEGVKRSYK